MTLTADDTKLAEYIHSGESVPIRKSEKITEKNCIEVKCIPSVPCKNPASVAKRNARERRRIQNVNKAFDELREHVPIGSQNKKISKVCILRVYCSWHLLNLW